MSRSGGSTPTQRYAERHRVAVVHWQSSGAGREASKHAFAGLLFRRFADGSRGAYEIILPEHIVAIEPFAPETQLPIPSERSFHARVLLLNRDNFLMEQTVEDFAKKHGLLLLPEDQLSVNAVDVRFSVETFVPKPGFQPTKNYRSRLVWTDLDGERQSKLLLTPPDTVLAVAVRGEANPSADKAGPSTNKPSRGRRRRPSVPMPA
jgi:hypothetical protein